ncbi:MAG: Cof-type HAD-IIB family hydrolase [Eubacteriales bacterium]
MSYEMLVLDLDGTLTNSEKKISPATKAAIRKVQEMGKYVVLASGRPTYGIVPLAEELELAKYGGYILSFNGGKIINCRTHDVIYNKFIRPEYIAPICEYVQDFDANVISYTDSEIISAFAPNHETHIEARINKMPIQQVDNFASHIDFPINKLLVTGNADLLAEMEISLRRKYRSSLNIFRSEPFFIEIMPQKIDKAHSLQKLLNSIGLSSNEMICCGDGFNDLTMIEYAGLGVAMANAQPAVLDKADFVTLSNDEDGVLHVIEKFML